MEIVHLEPVQGRLIGLAAERAGQTDGENDLGQNVCSSWLECPIVKMCR